MKKLLFLFQLTAAVILYPSISYADDDDHGWGGHGRGHHGWGGHGYRHHGYGHHGWGHHGHHREHYYPQPQINYYPPPQINYYPQPQVHHYHQQPRYYDPRSHQGLAGGVIGSVFGYEIGNGDPVAAGLGAAAGSFLGNGIGGGW